MAATSGHSSGPSNSAHYPASSSSGTPCSASQSSGTVVVPLIISTYISFDGPSVASTLPATSSANLPVVVGGSYGGATGSVSSTFPSLNKAFVVGPGYAPVLYNIHKLIFIIQTAKRFSDKSWLCYDIAFGKEAAASGSTDWSRVRPNLYNFHTRSPTTTSAAPGSTNPSNSSALS
ncbi:unnamed protein product, partial [Porites lobata]